MKYPSELLLGENKFVVPPKVFGYTCFVRDHRPSMTKLDPRAIKCIFIGYPAGQRGYKCWSPSERPTFVSIDVTFWESNPFYGEKTDLSAIFEGLDQPLNIAGQEGESASGSSASNNSSPHVKQQPPQHPMIVGSIPLVVPELPHARSWPKPNEEQDLRVYSRRPRIEEQGEHHAEE
jgi:hypothetical protein